MTPCEELGYAEGDLFEVINTDNPEYITKGMILRLDYDDGSDYPGFEYISGDATMYTESVSVIYVNLECVKKVNKLQKSIVPETDKTTEVTYSVQDIEAAFEHLGWMDNSKDKLLEALKVVTDSEYKEYLRLKQKYGTK